MSIATLEPFDPVSRQMLQGFARKAMFLLLVAAGISLADPRRLGLACALLQAQCLMCIAMSVAIALSLRQRFDAPALTYWDEAVAFCGIGMLCHIAAPLIGA